MRLYVHVDVHVQQPVIRETHAANKKNFCGSVNWSLSKWLQESTDEEITQDLPNNLSWSLSSASSNQLSAICYVY